MPIGQKILLSTVTNQLYIFSFKINMYEISFAIQILYQRFTYHILVSFQNTVQLGIFNH